MSSMTEAMADGEIVVRPRGWGGTGPGAGWA